MHKDFKIKYESNISYGYYRQYVSNTLNILYAQLGHEECEDCEAQSVHCKALHGGNAEKEHCRVCQKWVKHYDNYRSARKAYQNDKKKEWQAREICLSVDLQKVIMLPRMETFQSVCFTRRLVAFNETFVPVAGQKNKKPFAAVWHEGIAGRKCEEIISTYYQFLLFYRDEKKIVIWLDNCAGQNKNWALLSFFVFIINSNEVAAETIELKYFEPGHTFMSADHFHHCVENSMKRKKNVYDFPDFVQCVKDSKSKVEVKQMEITHFYDWEDWSSLHKLKQSEPRAYLKDMYKIKFQRGSKLLEYATSSSDDATWVKLDFLKVKIMQKKELAKPNSRQKNRGFLKAKKELIIN